MDNVLTLNFDIGPKKDLNKNSVMGRVPHFHGRNGTNYCTGIEIWLDEDKIKIQPITSQNKVGNCFIEMPTKDIINKIPVSLRPLFIGLHPAIDEVLGKRMMIDSQKG